MSTSTLPVHELVLERMRKWTPKDWHDSFVRAGICTPDGELTPEYGGLPRVICKGGTFVLNDGQDHRGTMEDVLSQALAELLHGLYAHRFQTQGALAQQLAEARAGAIRKSYSFGGA